jgi:RNA polymerase sigma factor (sigma-70 family)
MNHAHEEDRQLLTRCLDGDRRASEAFVKKFSGPVYRSVQHTLILKGVAFNKQDLEDLHNTVFLQLFENNLKKLRQYQGKNGCSLSSWIRLVAVRIVLNHFRKKGIDGILWKKKQNPLENCLEEDDRDALDWMELAEQERLLENGLRNLSPRDRLFIRLHLEGEIPIQEVAKTMGLSIQNAYTVKTRTIQRLKSHVMSVLNG